jgi:hypothetical protein
VLLWAVSVTGCFYTCELPLMDLTYTCMMYVVCMYVCMYRALACPVTWIHGINTILSSNRAMSFVFRW